MHVGTVYLERKCGVALAVLSVFVITVEHVHFLSRWRKRSRSSRMEVVLDLKM